MPNPIDDLIAGFQDLVGQVPELVQPLVIALAGAVPFIEAEGSAAIGVIGGLNPFVAASAGIVGNFVSVALVVLLGSRIREAAVARRARRTAVAPATAPIGTTNSPETGSGSSATMTAVEVEPAKVESKGRQKMRRWIVRFGVPGASVLGPLAIPTHFTASLLVASGVRKGWVLLWQAIAIVLWTGLLTAVATGFLVAVDT